MFKISYQTLRSDGFRVALQKVVNCSKFDTKTAYRIMRLTKELEKALLASQQEWVKLAEKYVKKKDGKFAYAEGDFDFLDGVDKEAARAEIMAFGAKETIIDRWKLKVEELGPAGLSPADMSALEPMLLEENQ